MIVAIGASAGGLDALRRFFSTMPAHPQIAFVVVVHLSPTHPSLLAELLMQAAAMPVKQVDDNDQVTAPHVYVVPPNHYLRIERGVLRLDDAVGGRAPVMPIDHFMRSLAEDQQGMAAGIVMSGADHDGTVGLKEIRAAGGFTIAQEPATAEHASMPVSALAANPDWVLPVEEMPRALVDYVEHNTPLAVPSAAAAEAEDEVRLDEILAVVRAGTGHDFRGYRSGMLLRRVQRRMALGRLTSVDGYLTTLRESGDEVNALTQDFLIGVTEFFRDAEAWQALESRVASTLAQQKDRGEAVRVWCAGCATGEEAYSVAMLFLDAFAVSGRAPRLQVFASDIDQEALQVARNGEYAANIEATMPPDRLRRFFRKVPRGYEVKKELREVVLFAPQNLLSDPPFSKLDLIVCRNLLIYLEPSLQQQIIELFHFALRPGGYLFLGKSESLGVRSDRFHVVDKSWRIHRSIGAAQRVPRQLFSRAEPHHDAVGPVPETRGRRVETAVRDLLLARHAPAAVLVNRDNIVLYFYGRTAAYLSPPEGEPSFDLLVMARRGLSVALRAALQQVHTTGIATSTEARVEREVGRVAVKVQVEPVHEEGRSQLLLVTFEDRPQEEQSNQPVDTVRPIDESAAFRHLEEELRSTREDLQGAVDELRTANEELRVANEEAMSTNEELQSANEELETSKEELQSVNEELTTVNAQLDDKVHDLEHMTDDLSNLLSSTHVPTLLLDRTFRIQRYTPTVTRLFKVIPTDLNRPLGDIAWRVVDEKLLEVSGRVLETLVVEEKEVATDTGEWFLRRVLPYRTANDRVAGVVITYIDITALRRNAENMRRLATVVRDSNDPIIVYTFDGRIVSWNQAAARTYGYSEEEALAMQMSALLPEQLRGDDLDAITDADTVPDVAEDSQRVGKDGRIIHVSVTRSILRDDDGHARALVSTERDITERKRMEQALRESEARFREMADHVPALIWIADAQRRFHFANRGYVEYTGRPIEMLLGEGWFNLIHSDDVETYTRRYADAFAQRIRFDADFRLRRADGEYRWMRSVAVPRHKDGGEFFGYVGLTIDVHERTVAEQALAQADQRKNEFLAMLGHELRNPLAPIRTAGDLISRLAPANPDIRWAAGVINRQTHQMTRLVDDLLDMARIARGKIELDLHIVDLASVVQRGCETSRPLVDERKHRLSIDLPEEPLRVNGDLLRLAQVVGNLLGNAAKFTPEGGSITVALARTGNDAVIRVIDNGVGIAQGMLTSIFELFTQANATLDRSQGGLGLGLTLAKQLVEMHGGRIRAESAGLGRGSTFAVWLPLVETASIAEAQQAEPSASTESLRLLVVDDNVDAAESLALLLRFEGHQVQTAHDGKAALAAAQSFEPQVVLLDIGLPGMNGYEVAHALRMNAALPQPIVIALTGYGQPHDTAQAKAAGFDHHLLKPVQVNVLVELIRSIGTSVVKRDS